MNLSEHLCVDKEIYSGVYEGIYNEFCKVNYF